MTTVSDAPTSSVSVARTIAKALHWTVLGWTVFCAGSAVFGFARMSLQTTRADGSGALLVGTAIGLGVWGLLWIVPVVVAELLAIGLSVTAGKPDAAANRREWWIAFLCAFVPNGGLALLLLLQLLTFPV
jgi:hypothetical protein